MSVDIQRIKEQVLKHTDQLERIRAEVRKVLVGQDNMLSRLLIALLTGGHVLLEGLPGLAKTTAIKGLANAIHCQFQRIQFTPDLLPADLIGTMIYNPREGSFGTRKGPIFANLVLADEINRAAPKTQSALLEAMAEHHVTIGGATHDLDDPFLVIATQNPIEQEGTYPLPEAQLDRFMMEIRVGYPTIEQEREIVMKTTAEPEMFSDSTMTREDFIALRKTVRAVPVPYSVVDYAVLLCNGTRPEESGAVDTVKKYVAFGAGPRGSQNLVLAAKARALLEGRTAPIVADVRAVAEPILRHRILMNHRAIGDGYSVDKLIKTLLESRD